MSDSIEGSLLDGRYEIRSCLGKGGMGVVYEAFDRALEERVAIKVLRGQDSDDTAKRFRAEIKLARKVTHRNVCRIHDYGEAGGVQYISMQYLEGADLRAHLRAHGRLPPDHAFAIALQIAEGLQAVHDEGIVHRDLKTANVMLDGQGVARLMDFGIAKDTGGGESLTHTGQIVGTPEYMSPEQIRGQHLDARSDVYALGVILFELFTGGLPFKSDSPVGTLMKHLHDDPPLDAPTSSVLAAPLREVIRTALAKERDHRYRSARELADALGAARVAAPTPANASVPARPVPSPISGRTVKQASTEGLGRGVWALMLLALLAAPFVLLIGWNVLSRGASPEPNAPSATLASASTVSPTLAPRPVETSTASPPSTLRALEPAVDPATPLPQLLRLCAGGSGAACALAGVRYNQEGPGNDVGRAAEYYEKACALRSGAGCNNLGSLFEYGRIGLGANPSRAHALYRQGCDLGDAQACRNLER